MRIDNQLQPDQTWATRQIKKKELRKLSKEIQRVRLLLHKVFEQTADFQNTSVMLISTHLDTLLVRYQRIEAEINDKSCDDST